VVLQTDAAGRVEDVGSDVARGPDGRFYTSNGRSGKVTVWNPDGSFRQNFGSAGMGPGEFATGSKKIFFEKNGRLLIGSNDRIAVYSATYEYVSTIPAAVAGQLAVDHGALLDDGNWLSTRGGSTAFSTFSLNLQTSVPSATLVRNFGPASSSGIGTEQLSYSAGNSFWVAPSQRMGQGYTLELWRTTGTRALTIRRDAPWLPNDGRGQASGEQRVPAEMEILHEDGTGLVFVAWVVPNATFFTLSAADRASQDPNGPANRAIDIYMEVIDANAGVVLASIGPIHPSEAMKELPIGFVRGSRLGYRRDEDANGLPLMRMLDVQLVAR
jgi:hypothetical protein